MAVVVAAGRSREVVDDGVAGGGESGEEKTGKKKAG